MFRLAVTMHNKTLQRNNKFRGKQFHSPKIQLEGYQPTQWQCSAFVCFHRCELMYIVAIRHNVNENFLEATICIQYDKNL